MNLIKTIIKRLADQVKFEKPRSSPERDYSQHGEQSIIERFFAMSNLKYEKYCVDAGAFDGVVGSNSRMLFSSGWAGVAIEPNPRTFERLSSLYKDRPDVNCIRSALSDIPNKRVKMEFSIGPEGTPDEDKWQFAQLSSLNPDFTEKYKTDLGYIYETQEVITETLESVLDRCSAPRSIGFMSIDCEGEDIKIIQNFDFVKYHPLLLCVEADDNTRNFFSEILRKRGYSYRAHTIGNTFFASDKNNSFSLTKFINYLTRKFQIASPPFGTKQDRS